ncbi:DUF354 domain-containing protein [candidate division KSB1 bacterium]|nr:MAG: DUF354 domain-containing protein [candidate division KSB1 bacterium]
MKTKFSRRIAGLTMNGTAAAPARRILVDICHPAEVHHFKYIYWELSRRGWTFLFAAKRKDVTEVLLRAYGLPSIIFSESKRSLLLKILHLPPELWAFYRLVRTFRPTLLFSNLSVHSSWIGAICGLRHIAFIDTEHRRLLDVVTMPFAQVKLTPESYGRHLGSNHIRYRGNHELAYLSPQRFKPNPEVRDLLGIGLEPYVVLRFVAWQAFHDVGRHGISHDLKVKLVLELQKTRRVFISSEVALSKALQPYQLNVPPERIHDVLYYADAYIGEGGTMASEAACLGTPAVYINRLGLGYCQEEARAGLLHHCEKLSENDIEWIVRIHKTAEFQQKHKNYMKGHIDVTDFIVQFIEQELNQSPGRTMNDQDHEGCSGRPGSFVEDKK